ncbi:MAG: response regulator transcription factor [Oscillospiraceae bacterium]|nr:response regulator transcription factor [Oscillospiraceae bacterium]
MNERIVVVEDDESIRRLIEVALSSHGYTPIGFGSAEDALPAIESAPPALAIFDIMMDGMDGVEAVRKIRESKSIRHIPIIMLTAKDTELDKVVGLDAGADDYITKPFSVLELCARVRAQLRRISEQKSHEEIWSAGALTLNAKTREVIVAREFIELTFKEFALLHILIENQERAIEREELLAKVWGNDYYGETRTLDIHIATIRQKLRVADSQHEYIKTVRGVGYRFTAPTI